MKLYKLSFTNKAEWDSVKTSILIPSEDGNYPSGTYTNNNMTVVEVGNVPIDATYSEDGEVLTEASFNTDWAVDILSEKVVDVGDYIVRSTPDNWRNSFYGVNDVPEVALPSTSWLKAEIQSWLTDNGIEYNNTMTKSELLNLI